jgi:hypothetical protein
MKTVLWLQFNVFIRKQTTENKQQVLQFSVCIRKQIKEQAGAPVQCVYTQTKYRKQTGAPVQCVYRQTKYKTGMCSS